MKELKATWRSDAQLPLQFVDNMKIVGVNDQMFITFGQLDFSDASGTGTEGLPESAQIQPVVRLVLTRQGCERIAGILMKTVTQTGAEKP